MNLRSSAIRVAALATLAAAAGCSSTAGTGGLTIPQTQGYGQPNGPATVPQAASRQQVQSNDVALAPDAPALTLPPAGGFGIAIALGTPDAVASPAPSATGSPRAAGSPAPSAPAGDLATPAPSPSAAPSGPAVAAASGPVASAASPSPGAAASAPARPRVKISASTVAYPDSAPSAPTPSPNPESSASPAPVGPARTVLVRGTFRSPVKLELAGLDAISVTVPAAESTTGRGFTIALYRKERKHREVLVASDAGLAATGSVVKSAAAVPLPLAAGATYEIFLYGDPIATPPPVASSYPTPGTNPFYPAASTAPGFPGASGAPAYGAPAVPGAPTVAPPGAPGAGGLPAPHG